VTRFVVFRADASATVGTGHVVRCLALADEMRNRGWQTVLAAREITPNHAETATASGHRLLVIPGSVPVADEAAFLGENGVEANAVVVVDHYGIDAAWHRQARTTGAKLVAIDDLADRPLDVDLIVNPNLGASEDAYRNLVAPNAAILCGPAYALLRRQFAEARARRRPHRGSVSRVLVSMGGVDLENVTLEVLEAIAPMGFEVDAVVGGAYPHGETLARWEADRTDVQVHREVEDMADLMLTADLAVGAAGTTSWERCCLGLPTVMIAVAENQLASAQALDAAGAAVFLGMHDEVASPHIRAVLERLRRDTVRLRALSEAAAELVDGFGIRRVADAIG
jgi:UDP-2,4-diacetamido-2,4,6-trideoxy-beta-L-altropyranose hydrolase